ncbi:MAG: hypothetical protein H7Z74_17275 [Anaerolineae bacterium]|nr:hypothetical protein [Gemmatimonadaceae bacterium]
MSIATAYAGLGQKDQSFQWLDSAFVDRSGTLTSIKVLPSFASLRPDPRFNRLLKRIGLEP